MRDVYSKFGVVIVAALIVTLMVSFAYRTVKTRDFADEFPALSGTKEELVPEIVERCKHCVGNALEDRDCFIMSITLKGESITRKDTEYSLTEVNIKDDILPGAHKYKMKSAGGKCEVTSIG